jgi:signal transduction histidine kinase
MFNKLIRVTILLLLGAMIGAAAPNRASAWQTDIPLDQALVLAVRPAFEPLVKIVRELATELPRVVGYGLDYAFANVIKNAYDAMPSGGTLTISTRQQNGEMMIRFTDTGCGIPEQVRGRIFEPFFTTKPIGKGTGLGLAICKEIVDRSEGRVEIESAVGQGTSVIIALPIGRSKRSSTEETG